MPNLPAAFIRLRFPLSVFPHLSPPPTYSSPEPSPRAPLVSPSRCCCTYGDCTRVHAPENKNRWFSTVPVIFNYSNNRTVFETSRPVVPRYELFDVLGPFVARINVERFISLYLCVNTATVLASVQFGKRVNTSTALVPLNLVNMCTRA